MAKSRDDLKIPQHRAYLASYLVLMKNKKILLLRRKNTGYQDGNYSMVAGHLNGNETIREAMKREAKEETGIVLNVKDMKLVHILHRQTPDREYVDFFLSASKWKGRIKNMEPEKCYELRWFKTDALPKNTIPYVRSTIKKILDPGPIFSEHGFDG
jgi:ADP-ribose pyrophosphatase YjhB (NUDIX family)